MNKNLTIHGETLAASQEGTLAAEQFLQEHYFFRRNVLSGKVEFAVVPSEGEPQYRVLTQEALNSIIIRAKREEICEKGSPKTEITELIHSEEVTEHNPIREFLENLPAWDGKNHIAQLFSRIPGISTEQHAALKQTLSKSKVNGRPIYGCAQEDRPRYASFVATTNNHHPLTDATGSRRYICLTIPEGMFIDNTGEIDYQQFYAQVLYEIREKNAPYWFNNEEVARIQELNLDYMEKKDIAEVLESCIRKPKDGEQCRKLKSGEILKLIQREFPSIKSDHSTKVHLGFALKEMGFECKTHGNQSYYKVVPIKAA